jgi:serine-type D-Ala-D-Ala carboxypeptidase (penicillin-binding protein 5/6)
VARHRRLHPTPRALRVSGLSLGVVLGGALVALAAVPLPKVAPTLALAVHDAPAIPTHLALPFPAHGEAAVGIPSFKVTYATRHQTPVPIASLTKLMTAYVTLRDLPLSATAAGPVLEVSSAEATLYRLDQQTDQSSVKVAVGERLNERELLEGMLVHSANNFADMLGALVAGSDDTMVQQMNAAAVSLGLTETSYVDVSGIDPRSESDAIDQLELATRLMANPTFRSIVRMTTVTLPVAGVVTTYTPYLGQGGVVGVKTGFTSQAGGCDVMAYDDHVGRHHVLILAVVLGQTSTIQTPLEAAGLRALHLAAALARHLHGDVVEYALRPIGVLGWSTGGIEVDAARTIDVPRFTGARVSVTVVDEHWGRNEVVRGQRVATLVVTSGAVRESTDLMAATTLTRSSLWQRLR